MSDGLRVENMTASLINHNLYHFHFNEFNNLIRSVTDCNIRALLVRVFSSKLLAFPFATGLNTAWIALISINVS